MTHDAPCAETGQSAEMTQLVVQKDSPTVAVVLTVRFAFVQVVPLSQLEVQRL